MSTRPVKPPPPLLFLPPPPLLCHSPFSSSLFVLIPGTSSVLPGFGECLVSKGNWHLTCNFMVSLHLPLMSGSRLGPGCGGKRDGVLLHAPPRVSSSPPERFSEHEWRLMRTRVIKDEEGGSTGCWEAFLVVANRPVELSRLSWETEGSEMSRGQRRWPKILQQKKSEMNFCGILMREIRELLMTS